MDEAQAMITTECPNGHRVRGTEEFLNRQVRCPRCHVVFNFTESTSRPVPVIAVEDSLANPQGAQSPADMENEQVEFSDTGIMRILGDWTPPPSRPCPNCGTVVPGALTVCHECYEALGETDLGDSVEVPVINRNEFEDVSVRRIMRPRSEIAFLNVNSPIRKLQQFVRCTMHTRYPVCEGTLDAPLGVVHIKDVLVVDNDDDGFQLTTIMTPLERIPEKLPISGAFRHFQATRRSIALVVNASGETTGIVTLKDILTRMAGVEEQG